ncbi:parvulin-like peptidyl-prolyl cis-trans isomerase protein [Prosthecobacter fusiformis]|uniref:peptidylprolyl isomerase n=1 Tax=Prosthecobacter fusiformis TaxID=48464 RepID=A0A4R7RNB9_9BACT|nr:peptidylprolyl isomerase [Prosthecobacter fusiformis]TDU66509.1 parvulin-like peptidyl-prolyl cis-trans isomerase protein [Prosthecobacter fusiformis]
MALIINGEEIDDEVIEGEFRNVKGHYERMLQVSCCERDQEFRGYAKDNLISRVLLNQESVRRFPTVEEAEVTARLEKLIAEAGGETQFYMNIGMPYKDEAVVRENVQGGVRLDKMLGDVYGPEPVFSEEELHAAYERDLPLYMTEEMIQVAHITKNLQGAQSRTEVFKTMRDLRTQLLAGADFMKLAEENRADDQQQIDLGWFKRGEFMEEFEVIAFSMGEGEISPVFTTQLGFHLCTVRGRKTPEAIPYAAVKEAVRQRLLEAHKDAKFNELIAKLKSEAKIEDTEPEEGGH